MKNQIHSLLFASVLLVAGSFTLHADPALLGNKGLTGQTLDADTIKAVLLGKKSTLGDARVIVVIIKASDAQEAFLKDHVGMTTDQFNTYWRRLYMTGGGSAPKNVDSEDEASKLVAATPGAIAVIDSAKADGLVVLAAK
jgi:hypothetical protein